jgi:hypothetical protein
MTREIHPDGNRRFTIDEEDARTAIREYLERRNALLDWRWTVKPDNACGEIKTSIVWNATKHEPKS